MRPYLTPVAMLTAALIGLAALTDPALTHRQVSAATAAVNVSDLRTAMRKLWEDHITWTRNYIVSALAGLEDAGTVAQRLLENQDDIGAAIKPYYGDAAGKKLAELLRDHIVIATEVVTAAKAGKNEQLAAAQRKWQSNGDDIATFLSGANSHWPRKAMQSMLRQHLEFTTGEVVARLKKDWPADIKAYDDGHEHMLMFADTLADGIAKQFPAKFKRTSETKPSH
jgi:hypothetical protein